MITPIEIQNKSFKSGGLGYDKKDVDTFMREVLDSYESIYRENVELNDKIATLSERLKYYTSIEKTLQKALVLAEKTAEDTKKAAEKEAKHIEREAQVKYQIVLSDAKAELRKIHRQTVELMQQYELYKSQFKNLAAAQIELIESDSFKINVASVDDLLGKAPQDSNDDKIPRAEDDNFWSQPLPNIESYLDDEIKPNLDDIIEGQEEFSLTNLEDED